MKLSDIEKKMLMLALDAGASDGEIAASATKFVRLLRKRYKNGVDLIKEMEGWDRVQQPIPQNPFQQWQGPMQSPFGGVSFTRPFGQPPPNPSQPQTPPPRYQQDFNAAWQEILRKAQASAEVFRQRQYQAHAAAFAAQQQANAHAQTEEHKEWAKEQLKKKPTIWEKIFG